MTYRAIFRESVDERIKDFLLFLNGKKKKNIYIYIYIYMATIYSDLKTNVN